MAKDKRGTKRQCEECGMKYYDLDRDPILCPGCQEPYVEPPEPTPRRGKAAPVEPKKQDEATSNEVETDPAAAEAGVETVSFEEAESDDSDDADASDAKSADEVTDGEEAENIGGEVDNSFVDDEDDSGAEDNYGLNTTKDEE